MGGPVVLSARAALRQRWQRRFQKWVNRRIPAAREVTLNQRRIFIFPSRTGFFFLFCLFVMLLAAINYQNNMSFALVFLLANVFLVSVLHTYANLSGLTIRGVSAQAVFPGQASEFRLRLTRKPKRQHFALSLNWRESDAQTATLARDEFLELSLYSVVQQRGWHSPGRLLIESVYPIGLLRCWTWVDLDLQSLVYPEPIAGGSQPGLPTRRPGGTSMPTDGNDDFFGIRDYRAGDSRKRIHWKGLAKGQDLQSKVYTAYADRSVFLDWEMFAGQDTEMRLSRMCFHALEMESEHEEYGLRLPGLEIAPGTGQGHLEAILRALALHGLEDIT